MVFDHLPRCPEGQQALNPFGFSNASEAIQRMEMSDSAYKLFRISSGECAHQTIRR
ncbi:protein of unknown function [Nitrospira japonica]|uniref:Uncharacterized protein n=1 Tax=Nitrospira japonica TaxID=1325564 RepID=A0A1W1I7Y1_9BACT|nr:protein of unknown function [Nitrospira japonica]